VPPPEKWGGDGRKAWGGKACPKEGKENALLGLIFTTHVPGQKKRGKTNPKKTPKTLKGTSILAKKTTRFSSSQGKIQGRSRAQKRQMCSEIGERKRDA